MRKLFFIVIAMLMPAFASAQNVWEQDNKPKQKEQKAKKKALFESSKQAKAKDAPYLKGAVPEVDGKVEFDTIYTVPGKSKEQIYNFIHQYLLNQTTEEGQLDNLSKMVIEKPEEGTVAARYSEWLVFKKSALVLDQTRFNYNIIALCSDGKLEIRIKNLSYDYEEESTTQHYSAEEWIADKVAVNKKNTKLYPISGKFRRKTVDRVRYTFRTIDNELKAL